MLSNYRRNGKIKREQRGNPTSEKRQVQSGWADNRTLMQEVGALENSMVNLYKSLQEENGPRLKHWMQSITKDKLGKKKLIDQHAKKGWHASIWIPVHTTCTLKWNYSNHCWIRSVCVKNVKHCQQGAGKE